MPLAHGVLCHSQAFKHQGANAVTIAPRERAKRLVQTVAVTQMSCGAFLVGSIDVGVGLITTGVMLLLVSEWRKLFGSPAITKAQRLRA